MGIEPLGVSTRRRVLLLLVFAAALPALVVVLDAVGGRHPLDEGLPRADVVAGARSAVLVVAVAALLRAVELAGRPARVAWPVAARVFAVLGGAVAIGTGVLAAVDPQLLFDLGQEDRLVETVSAVAFLLAGVVLAVVAVRSSGWATSARVTGALLAVGLVVSGGEEISWGQRILGFAGPDALTDANLQSEANLHNLATDATETAFYAAAALGLVLLPYVVARTGLPRQLVELRPLVPPAWVAVVGAAATPLNLDMWDVVPVQLTFWTGVGVLLLLARVDGPARRWLLAAAATVAVVQVMVLATGGAAVELHDVTEPKELVLGIAAFAWVWAVATRSSTRPADRA